MMKITKTLATVTFLLISYLVNAQHDKLTVIRAYEEGALFPLFTFGDEIVMNNEFLRVFNKNRNDKSKPTQKEMDEYLDLYIKFKLKVKAAYSLKMDTVPSFKKELAGYRKQLAQPYLTDKTVTEKLVKEAYERSQMEVSAAHLLINCAADAKPSDTLSAYEKIMGLRNRIAKGGESFESIASQYSEDPSAKANKGNLGYFTVFQMIYPFEKAAFTTKVGEVSLPIRTRFGYHLVYVKDKRETQGDIKVAHIAIKYYNPTQIDSSKERIDAVYAKLQAGADWNTIVEEFSEDFNTNSKGGELGWFNRTTSSIPAEFKNAAYELQNDDDYSAPVKTKFSWHILKRMEMKEKLSYDDSKDFLRRKVERDSRSELNKDVVVARIIKDNNYQEVAGLNAVKNEIDASLLQGQYKKKDGKGIVLCTIGDKEYTDDYFYAYVATNQARTNKTLDNAIVDIYENFVKQINLDFEEGQLEDKYEDFKHTMQEYSDGILLFELMDKEVWSKAVKDTAGLEAFYAKNKARYMWKERAVAAVYSCNNAKTAKQVKKLVKKGKTASSILEKCNAKDALAVSVVDKTIEKGSDTQLSNVGWEVGVADLPSENDRIKFVKIHEILPVSAKSLKENLGQVTSDYQDYLEATWIESLKKSYPVEIYERSIGRLFGE
ncbi:MAG: peptidylprolyl isomerase [Bacteroidia bacterium]|nr:peptidylprolyl isomerase [Bacteroidia bacterium]